MGTYDISKACPWTLEIYVHIRCLNSVSIDPGKHMHVHTRLRSMSLHITECCVAQVRWRGQDSEGRPVLVVQVAQACQLVHGAQADLLAKVVLSQVCAPLSLLYLCACQPSLG